MTWYRFDAAAGTLLLELHVQPGARSEGISLFGDDLLKVRITAKAIDGAANAALAAYIGERLGVARSRVKIVRGATGRRKLLEVRVADFDPASLLVETGA